MNMNKLPTVSGFHKTYNDEIINIANNMEISNNQIVLFNLCFRCSICLCIYLLIIIAEK